MGHEDAFPPPRLSVRFSIAANVKPPHTAAVLRFDSPVIRGSRFSSRSASGRLISQETLARTHGNGRDAPIPAVRVTALEPRASSQWL